jgi:voltage-gated sodium channel
MKALAQRVVESPRFEPFMIGLILFNAVLIGLETSHGVMAQYGDLLHLGNDVILWIFIIEAALKIAAVAPRVTLYFGNGWNLFDFTIVILSLAPATGEFALVGRLIRVLRVLRLVSAVPQLRLIVATLVRSIPSMGHVIALMSIVFYIYAVMGFHLFHQSDPEHWGTLGDALLTLFSVVTLEGWVQIMEVLLQPHPWAWVYFVTFILIGTFVMLNLFIAVVINNLDASKAAELEALESPPSRDEIVDELKRTREVLAVLQRKLEALPGAAPKS